jgi:toluene monooxygenase system ferredoxin subunit
LAWKRLCALAELRTNGLTRTELEGVAIMVADADGTLCAFPPLCPHMAEPLELSGVCDGATLTCTKHLWQWELPAGTEQGMAEKPLLMYPVRRTGEAVEIDFAGELSYDYDE